jgi:hypothetical protein
MEHIKERRQRRNTAHRSSVCGGPSSLQLRALAARSSAAHIPALARCRREHCFSARGAEIKPRPGVVNSARSPPSLTSLRGGLSSTAQARHADSGSACQLSQRSAGGRGRCAYAHRVPFGLAGSFSSGRPRAAAAPGSLAHESKVASAAWGLRVCCASEGEAPQISTLACAAAPLAPPAPARALHRSRVDAPHPGLRYATGRRGQTAFQDLCPCLRNKCGRRNVTAAVDTLCGR